MARHDQVDHELLHHLAQLQGSPILTVAVPTHRWGPELAQDRVLLLDTVEQAATDPGHRLWPDLEAAADRLRREAASIDMEHLLDGLVVYASAQRSGHVTVAGPVARRAAVGTRVALADLVRHVDARRPALVVNIAETGARAWWKDHGTLTEISGEAFPFELVPDEHHRKDRWNFGRQQTALVASQSEELVRDVERRIDDVCNDGTIPVFIAAQPKLAARFAATTRLGVRLSPHRLGVLNHPTHTTLADVAHQIDVHLAAAQRHEHAAALDAAVGARRIATDLDEITELIHDGNSAALMLDDAALSDAEGALGARLDHAITTLISRGDQVDLVDTATLGAYGPHVLLTRY